MPFDVTLDGITYEIDAPDQATAKEWATIAHAQNKGSTPLEDTSKLQAPLENAPLPQRAPTLPESDRVSLDSANITPEFASDFRVVTGGLNPYALGKTPRQAIDAAVARGELTPDFVPSDDFGAFKSQWQPYLNEMTSSIGGAFARGAKGAAGATVGGAIGAGVGQVAGTMLGGALGSIVPVAGTAGGAAVGSGLGAVTGGMVGGALGNLLQKTIEDEAGLMSDAERAQAKMDEARAVTKYAKLFGEVAPSLAFQGPNISGIQKALAGNVGELAGIAAGGAIGGAVPAAVEAWQNEPIDTDRVLVGIASGALLRPWGVFNNYFDRVARTEMQAVTAAGKTVQQVAADPGLALKKLAEANLINRDGIKLGPGLISADEGLIGLESYLFNQTPQLKGVRQQNLENIAQNLNTALAPQEASLLSGQQFFRAKHDELMARAQRAYQGRLAAGEAQQAAVLKNAQELAKQAQDLVDSRLISAETAHTVASNLMQTATDTLARMRGERAKPADVVFRTLQSESAVAKKLAEDALYKVDPNMRSSYNNFNDSVPAFRKLFSEARSLPSDIEALIALRSADKIAEEAPHASKLFSDLTLVGEEIQKSKDAGNRALSKALGELKRGLERDIEDLGAVSEDRKVFAALWKDYAQKYVNETSEKALVIGDLDPGKVIDHYMQRAGSLSVRPGDTQLTGAQQLRAALNENPAGLAAVGDWFKGKLAEASGALQGQKPSAAIAKNIAKYLADPHTKELLAVFPEVKPELELIAATFRKNVFSENASKVAFKAAQAAAKKPDTTESSRLTVAANKAFKDAERAALQLKEAEEKAVLESIGTKFFKTNPVDLVKEVLSDSTVVFGTTNQPAKMKELLDLAAKDSSGQATEAVKNAVRAFLNVQARKTGAITTSVNDPFVPVTYKDFEASYNELNKLLTEGSKQREAIAMALGSNSKELELLDLVRRQTEVLNRKNRATAGQSQTQPARAAAENIDLAIENNVFGLLHRMARGFNIRTVRGNALTNIMDVVQRAWSGDVRERALNILTDSITDARKLSVLLAPINNQTAPAARAFLKLYQVPDSFGEESPRETIGNSKVYTDLEYGFRVISKDGKRYNLYAPSKGAPIGVFESFDAAKQKADQEVIKADKLAK